jgi:hypothetical protein
MIGSEPKPLEASIIGNPRGQSDVFGTIERNRG